MSSPEHDNDFDAYQDEAMRTARAAGIDAKTTMAIRALGLAGESGEVADLVKKHVGHSHELDREKVKKELGDVLWYCATLAHALDLSLSEVIKANVVKLRTRYPEGFTVEDSKAKRDEQ